jgi:hypothetical protein
MYMQYFNLAQKIKEHYFYATLFSGIFEACRLNDSMITIFSRCED